MLSTTESYDFREEGDELVESTSGMRPGDVLKDYVEDFPVEAEDHSIRFRVVSGQVEAASSAAFSAIASWHGETV